MGEFLDFVSRHVFASIVGAAGMALTLIGFAEQAEKIATGWKAWQLQALGAALFFISVIMVLVSYDSERADVASADVTHPITATAAEPAAMGLLEREYLSLMSGKHTKLQEQKFLRTYVGKEMELSLELASIDGYLLTGQFLAGDNADVFVSFSREWADYLANKNVGDKIRFRATIMKERENYYSLGKAKPL